MRKNKDAPELGKSEGEEVPENNTTSALALPSPADEATPSEKPAETGPGAPEESKTEEAKPNDGRRPPAHWARKHDKIGKPSGLSINEKPRPAAFSFDHAAADQLHGWSLHSQHTTDEFVLSEDAYRAALAAATKPGEAGKYTPHPEAVSPFKRGTR